ncbi:transposase [Actinobaculum suis]|uniref:transposase n=1 Tax=Actinobaculum suis TaxID=1657 RepID=UPI000B30CFBE|nr:transposase [Actinobaculum suis]
MSGKRRRFTPEYRQDAASQVIDTGESIACVAKALGLSAQTLGKWVGQERKRRLVESGGKPDIEQLQKELARTQRELAKARMERDFLEKAAAFFAAKQQQRKRPGVDGCAEGLWILGYIHGGSSWGLLARVIMRGVPEAPYARPGHSSGGVLMRR